MWLALFRKEWQDSLPRFLLIMILNTLGFLIMLYLIEQESFLFLLIALPLIIVHVIYLFFEWLIAFSREWRSNTHVQWLNLPVSGWALITSKMAAGLSQFLISLIYAMIAAYVMLTRIISVGQEGNSVYTDMTSVIEPVRQAYLEFSPFILAVILHGAVMIGLAAVFIYLMAKAFKPLGWLIGIVLTFVVNWMISWLSDQVWFQSVQTFIPLLRSDDVIERLTILFTDFSDVAIDQTGGDVLYLGQIVTILAGYLLALGIFRWLLDKYVEA
ncbi:hypothetical protein [Salisediminibacterium beveridgei]|uniref:ABC-2 type transport system permease protein n=1 Tax=Salisediminibacterium beveridgei TaxID=632773 RepID=A0A1D7QVQ3_9BACI|nr:hypothetical protein [Salisediminibacterium beveridgei]AOM83049.1 hypothetical protein BBEV_1688 [Salisediminibacterium beveridgei]